MTATQFYRGYEITVELNGDSWRVWACPRTPDLPITNRRSIKLDAAASVDKALEEAKKRIDALLLP
jgi:hypothetical protein